MWIKCMNGKLVNAERLEIILISHDADNEYAKQHNREFIMLGVLPGGAGCEALMLTSNDRKVVEDAMEDIANGILTGAVMVDLVKRETFNLTTAFQRSVKEALEAAAESGTGAHQ